MNWQSEFQWIMDQYSSCSAALYTLKHHKYPTPEVFEEIELQELWLIHLQVSMDQLVNM